MNLRVRLKKAEDTINPPPPAPPTGACAGLAAFMRQQQQRMDNGEPLLPPRAAPRAYRETCEAIKARQRRMTGEDLA